MTSANNPFQKLIVKSPSVILKSTTTVTSNAPAAEKATKLPPNAKVIGNYLLGKNIGQGTFGKVYLAMHIPTKEKIAIKIIDKKTMLLKDVSRVKNQINILTKIRHRNIMQLYQILQTQKSLLLVTEYLQKGELFRQIVKQKKLSERQACIYFQQILAGVQYLHKNKIAHRDLKPENILIDYDSQLKIIDFGLSNEYKTKELKSFCGSPCYAAPEIIEGKGGYNPEQTDLWSCGIILFVMICGYLPFCDTDTQTLYKKIVACSYKIPAHVSGAARDLIQNLLAKDPKKRMSIKDIKDHQWFTLVDPPSSFGINLKESLRVDNSLKEKIMGEGIPLQNLEQNLQAKKLDKYTANYFIFMKKMVKNNQKMPTYIGCDGFDPSYKQGDEKGSVNNDQEMTTILDSSSGPEHTPGVEGPLAGQSAIFKELLPYSEVKQISEEELKKILYGIVQMVAPLVPLPTKTTLKQMFEPQNKNKQALLVKKKSQFYAFNDKNYKGVQDLQVYKQILLQVVQMTTILQHTNDDSHKMTERPSQVYSSKLAKKSRQFQVRTVDKPKIRTKSLNHQKYKRPFMPKKEQKRMTKDLQKLIDGADKKFAVKMLPYLNNLKTPSLRQKVDQLRNKHAKNTIIYSK